MSYLPLENQNGLNRNNLDQKIYSLISIGQRGSGKTVFLAGSYAQFKFGAMNNSLRSLWLECEDPEAEEKIMNVINYIARTGDYPPATMKITNFDFSLQQNCSGVKKTIGRICWWDTPGESCKIYNPAFLTMVIYASGCCLFLDAQSLANKAREPQEIEKLIYPIQTIADILHQNNLKHPLALIITKCDLLKAKVVNWQLLHKSLSPLTHYLSDLNINYQTFYSELPIKQIQSGVSRIESQTRLPLTWLVEEMKKVDGTFLAENISNLSLPTIQPTESLTPQFSQIFLLNSSKFLAFFVLLFLVGFMGLISQIFLSSQNFRLILPNQQQTQPLIPSR